MAAVMTTKLSISCLYENGNKPRNRALLKMMLEDLRKHMQFQGLEATAFRRHRFALPNDHTFRDHTEVLVVVHVRAKV